MLKHLKTYQKYLLFESAGSGKSFLMELDSVVNQAVDSQDDAITSTDNIRYFIDQNKKEIADNMTSSEFIKSLLTVLKKWHDKYANELEASEFDYLTGDQMPDSQGEEDDMRASLPSDEEEFPELDF